MEVLAAVASVAGVLSVTIKGIETIGKLKIFCDEVIADFFHDLTMLLTLLGSVKTLCAKLQVANFSQKLSFSVVEILDRGPHG